MKKYSIATIAAICALPVFADVAVEFSNPTSESSIIVYQTPLSDLVTARRRSEVRMFSDTVEIKNGRAHFEIFKEEPVNIAITLPNDNNTSFEIMASPEDNLTVVINGNADEYDYSVSGTPLMDGMTAMIAASRPFEAKLRAMQGVPGSTPEEMQKVFNDYQNVFSDFIDNNPNNPAAAFAMLHLEDERFLEEYAKLGDGAKASILFPMVEKSKSYMEESVASQRLQSELEQGLRPAPDFSLPDVNGQSISLSDFKGKWVILDFWGSWCGWCIKGFPGLKEAYKKYSGKLEIVGVDCGDTEEAWRKALIKFELPWVNVYNDSKKDTPDRIDKLYGVRGFPTKIIISPEGKIKKIFTGEDPEFYTYLASCINEK